ncbi:MOSC domain-containing protein [Phytoactinopolyspora halotolerans]|uniref:MOSC domain-containing protein n=1 Tax=Phytoactinopolyspora halotolerans TaxID=1981512 RepID=A0A6L9SDJ8_9ACTN|nr:MOSC N-terminal beta barrel domain-containing protein [Phytoactinopolyspora halotolerans]NEE02100.1 MOSC domain-containing protein [Phytoactinopolyspora halotolerans]
MRITQLNIYPVKSTRGREVDDAVVEPWGLAGDRRWMVVDGEGDVLTARILPRLLTVRATPLGEGRLRLDGPHAEPLEVDGTQADERVTVQVWRSRVEAMRPSTDADGWFGKLLERDVRLVWLDDPRRRPVDPEYGRDEDRVSFADAYPLLLASTGSLQQLNDWIVEGALERGEAVPEPLPMRRFRPNVVVDSEEPFAEDGWTRVRLGGLDFRVVKPCDRCVLTTIDPETLEKGKEPLRTLARHRRWDQKVWFGVNIIPDQTGRLRVGDPATLP